MELIKLQKLQENFNSVIEKSINQKFVVDNEITEVLYYVNNVSNHTLFRKPITPVNSHVANKVFELNVPDLLRGLFNQSFNQFMNTGSFIPERLHIDKDEMFQIKVDTAKQAFEFSEYYKWLIEKPTSSAKQQKNNPLYLNDKLLALHFLGLNTQDYDNTKCAEILAQILGVEKENIRKALSYLYTDANKNPVRTKENLEKSYQLFESQGLTEISKKIKSAIDKS